MKMRAHYVLQKEADRTASLNRLDDRPEEASGRGKEDEA
jgi:hypothetical protein